MTKLPAVLALSCLGAAASAQLPDVAPFADFRFTLRWAEKEKPLVRWTDVDGRASVVGLRFALDNGMRVKVAQRLQKVPGDPDQIDEAWVNLKGEWQAGKQYLPFGRKVLVRESVPALLFNTSLVFEGLPAEAAVFDGGKGRPRGVALRIGRPQWGISAAIGDHLVVQGTSMTPFRAPGQAPGKDRGHRAAYGVDGGFSIAGASVGAEFLLLRDGHTNDDRDQELSDIRATVRLPVAGATLEAGWARNWTFNEDVGRLGAAIPIDFRTSLRPVFRFDRSGFRDLSFVLWIRL